MKRKVMKLVAPFAFATILIFSHAEATAQNTIGYISAVQLSPSQFGQVAVSNITAAAVSTTINIIDANGSTFMTRTATVGVNKTFVFRFQNINTTAIYSAVVTSTVASSIKCDFQVLASNNEVAAVVQPQSNPQLVLNIPSVRLVPGQSAAATVTNITNATTPFSVTVLDNNGVIVVSQSASLSPGQTLSYSFSNMGTAVNGYRAVVSPGAANTVTSDVLLFDKISGLLTHILVPNDAGT